MEAKIFVLKIIYHKLHSDVLYYWYIDNVTHYSYIRIITANTEIPLITSISLLSVAIHGIIVIIYHYNLPLLLVTLHRIDAVEQTLHLHHKCNMHNTYVATYVTGIIIMLISSPDLQMCLYKPTIHTRRWVHMYVGYWIIQVKIFQFHPFNKLISMCMWNTYTYVHTYIHVYTYI